MSINIGIIGPAQSGKTTVFNALTGGKADTVLHRTEALAPNIGMAHVPEPRLKLLDGIFHPARTVYSEVKYIDIGASVKTLFAPAASSTSFPRAMPCSSMRFEFSLRR